MNNKKKVTEVENGKTCGFKRGLEAERILGSADDDNGELMYLMQWWVMQKYPCLSSTYK